MSLRNVSPSLFEPDTAPRYTDLSFGPVYTGYDYYFLTPFDLVSDKS